MAQLEKPAPRSEDPAWSKQANVHASPSSLSLLRMHSACLGRLADNQEAGGRVTARGKANVPLLNQLAY